MCFRNHTAGNTGLILLREWNQTRLALQLLQLRACRQFPGGVAGEGSQTSWRSCWLQDKEIRTGGGGRQGDWNLWDRVLKEKKKSFPEKEFWISVEGTTPVSRWMLIFLCVKGSYLNMGKESSKQKAKHFQSSHVDKNHLCFQQGDWTDFVTCRISGTIPRKIHLSSWDKLDLD